MAEIRPARASDHADVRRIFVATMVLGAPPDVPGLDTEAYARLCLDWYLHRGDAYVVEQDDRVKGYLLCCLDERDHGRWSRRAGMRWFIASIPALVGLRGGWRQGGRLRRFLRLRVIDGWRAFRHAPPPPHPAHAHFNLEAGVRGNDIGHRLAAVMDALVAARGFDGWYGEMNFPEGMPTEALTRAGAVLGHRQRSATFSWLAGVAVFRTRVARPLAGRTAAFRDRAAREATPAAAA